MAPESPPVLDIAAYAAAARAQLRSEGVPEAAAFVDGLRRALHEVGFCYVTGHGVDPVLAARLHDLAREFFARPLAERLRIENVNSPQFRGYTVLGSEHTNGRSDHRDQLDVGREQEVPALNADSPPWLRLQGPNLWPDTPAALRPVALAWMAQMEVLGDVVLRAVAEALGQPPRHFDEVMAPRPEIRVKIIRYPSPTPIDDATRQGVGAHRDNGLLTLLHQDGVGGLEIEHGGRFVAVPAVPGAYVLNIGEMLQLVSQGYLRATVHRVVSPPAGRERTSVAYFHNPRLDATLRPLRLPPQLAADAPGGASTDPDNPILARYGENALKVRLRSHPNVAARHHADLLDAPPSASAPATSATSAASVPAG